MKLLNEESSMKKVYEVDNSLITIYDNGYLIIEDCLGDVELTPSESLSLYEILKEYYNESQC